MFFGFVLLAIVTQMIALKQKSVESPPSVAVVIPPIQQVPIVIPPQRFCGCDELKRCHDEQLTKDRDLLTRCREECGARIFLESTRVKVVQCYEAYESKKSDADAANRQCVENMGSRICLEEGHQHTTPQIVTINATQFLHAGENRNHNRKFPLPDSVNTLNSCTKTCIRNQGIVQFNPDGTLVKSKTKTCKNGGNGEKEKQGKNGNGYSSCAALLNCQLSPLNKKIDKHAKQLCKFQLGLQEDNEFHLCTCLEAALGQTLHCTDPLPTTGTCSSTASQCAGGNKN